MPHEPSHHAASQPSASARWLACEASVPEHLADLVAEKFRQLGSSAVVFNEAPSASLVNSSGGWVVLQGAFPAHTDLQPLQRELQHYLDEIADPCADSPPIIRRRAIEDENLQEAWKSSLRPVSVGARLLVCPSWWEMAHGADTLVVRIDPGLAFGAGMHPTTQLCLRFLETGLRREPLPSCLDVGCGSGVLALAAAVLGSPRVVGIDCDPLAVRVAVDNAERNHIAERVRFLEAEPAALRERFGIVVANLYLDLLSRLLPTLRDLVEPGGCLISSGLLSSQLAPLLRCGDALGLADAEVSGEAGWVAVRFHVPPLG